MTTETPSLWLSLPEGFTGIDLAADPGDRMERMVDGLSAGFSAARPEQTLSVAIAAETALQAQLREGVVHFSVCLAQASDGTPVLGTFSLFIRPEELGPPGSYPQRVAEQLAAAWPEADVGVLVLPIGRTAVSVRDQLVPVPGVVYDVPESAVTTVRQVEFLIPHPWSPHVVAAVFTTEQVEYWEEWLSAVAAAVNGISFYPPRDETLDDLPPERWDNIRKAFG
jgi:hypothetical protein